VLTCGAFASYCLQYLVSITIFLESDEYKAVLHLANAERESKIQKLKAKLNYIRNRTPNRIPKPEENPGRLIVTIIINLTT